jgi:hypothetical protein
MQFLFLFIGVVGGPASAASPLDALTLFERCSAFVEQPKSSDGQLCDAYLRGFLQGAKAAGGKNRESAADESWTDRAARTRLGQAALARASYCVPDSLTVAELAERFIAHAETNPDVKNTDARSALEATLYVNYQCTA